MSKMSELSMMLDDLIACGTKLAETARALKDFYSSDEQEQPAPDKKTSGKKASKKQESPAQTPDPAPQPEPAKEYSKEDVRRILAARGTLFVFPVNDQVPRVTALSKMNTKKPIRPYDR